VDLYFGNENQDWEINCIKSTKNDYCGDTMSDLYIFLKKLLVQDNPNTKIDEMVNVKEHIIKELKSLNDSENVLQHQFKCTNEIHQTFYYNSVIRHIDNESSDPNLFYLKLFQYYELKFMFDYSILKSNYVPTIKYNGTKFVGSIDLKTLSDHLQNKVGTKYFYNNSCSLNITSGRINICTCETCGRINEWWKGLEDDRNSAEKNRIQKKISKFFTF